MAMKKKLKTICIIPARGGSKGLPGKNLRIFNGKPLIAWPIIAATNCKRIDDVIVTTDSEEIAVQAKLYGAQVPFLRQSNLAQDNTTTEATLRDALDKYEKLTKQHFDICVFLTCTDIFRDSNWLTNAIEKLENNIIYYLNNNLMKVEANDFYSTDRYFITYEEISI